MPLGAFKINGISKYVAVISRTAKTVVANGNAQVDTAQSKFGGASALFDGTSDYLKVTPASDFVFGTGDWTIEFWMRINSISALQLLWDIRAAGAYSSSCPVIYLDYVSGNPVLKYYAGTDRITSSNLSTATWYHCAISKASGNTRMFINGTQAGSTYVDPYNYNEGGSELWIGEHKANSGGFAFNGWLDEIRVSNSARYTSNFTSPTSAFVNDENTLLLIHANGTDASTTFTDDNS